MNRFSKLETDAHAGKEPEKEQKSVFRSWFKRKLEFKGESRPRPDPIQQPVPGNQPDSQAPSGVKEVAVKSGGFALEPIANESAGKAEAQKQFEMQELSRQALEKYRAAGGRERELERITQQATRRIALVVGGVAAVCLLIYWASGAKGFLHLVMIIAGVIFIALCEWVDRRPRGRR
jgi:hypothetical protein